LTVKYFSVGIYGKDQNKFLKAIFIVKEAFTFIVYFLSRKKPNLPVKNLN